VLREHAQLGLDVRFGAAHRHHPGLVLGLQRACRCRCLAELRVDILRSEPLQQHPGCQCRQGRNAYGWLGESAEVAGCSLCAWP
jgi:hypothetical protein